MLTKEEKKVLSEARQVREKIVKDCDKRLEELRREEKYIVRLRNELRGGNDGG